MLSGGQISAFFALNVTTSLKIPGQSFRLARFSESG
jgi:hypothetical protein